MPVVFMDKLLRICYSREEAPAGPTQEELLAEIRDLLKEKNA